MGTLRIDFKISIEVLDDTLCSMYVEILDEIGIFLGHVNFLPKYRMKITIIIYFRVRIKFQSFYYLSWKVFNPRI